MPYSWFLVNTGYCYLARMAKILHSLSRGWLNISQGSSHILHNRKDPSRLWETENFPWLKYWTKFLQFWGTTQRATILLSISAMHPHINIYPFPLISLEDKLFLYFFDSYFPILFWTDYNYIMEWILGWGSGNLLFFLVHSRSFWKLRTPLVFLWAFGFKIAITPHRCLLVLHFDEKCPTVD